MPLGFANPTSTKNASEILGEDNDSTFSNVLRWLGRPGFAWRSLLSGDLEGVGLNAAQMLLDLPTGGLISKRYSLARAFDSDGDLTTDKQRPEFTDLMQRWGADSPQSRGFWSNLALDVVGGTLTDPLSLLTGPGKGLAQGSLKGMGRVAAQRTALDALDATAKGRAALMGATDDVFGQIMGRVRPAPAGVGPVRQTGLARRLTEKGVTLEDLQLGRVDPAVLSPVRAAALQRGLAQRAAEDVFWKKGVGQAAKFAEDLSLAGHYDQGIASLERQALTRNPSALAWRVPFSKEIFGEAIEGAVLPGFWSAVGRYGTAPGWVRGLAGMTDATKPVAALMDGAYTQALDWVKGLYDKTLRGVVPEGMRHYTREQVNLRASKTLATQRRTVEIFGRLPDNVQETLGKSVDEYADLWRNATVGDLPNPRAVFERFERTAPRAGQAEFAEWVARQPLDTPARVDTGDIIRIGTAPPAPTVDPPFRGFAARPIEQANVAKSRLPLPERSAVDNLRSRALNRLDNPPARDLDALEAADLAARRRGIPAGAPGDTSMSAGALPKIEDAVEAAGLGRAPRWPGKDWAPDPSNPREAAGHFEGLLSGTKPLVTLNLPAGGVRQFRSISPELMLRVEAAERAGQIQKVTHGNRTVWFQPQFRDSAARVSKMEPPRPHDSPAEHVAYHIEFGRRVGYSDASIARFVESKFPNALSDTRVAPAPARGAPTIGDYTDEIMRNARDGRPLEPKKLQDFLERELKREVGPDGAKALDGYFADMRAAREELIREFPKQWHDMLANPFYLPHQIEPLFYELLGESMKDKTLAAALLDARKFGTGEAFRDELVRLSKQFGIEPENLDQFGNLGQDTHIGRLYRQRMMAQHHAVMKARIAGKAERLGMKEGDELHQYLTTQFASTQIKGPLRGVHTILAGGPLRLPFLKNDPEAIKWANAYDESKHLVKRRVTKDGSIEIDFPGLNSIWKPMLTSQPQNVAFHFRNVISAVFMGSFDPDLGIKAALPVFQSVTNGGLISALRGTGMKGDELAEFVRYLSLDPAVSKPALERLIASGKTIGKFDMATVAKTLDAAAGNRVSAADLTRAVGSIDPLGREVVASLADIAQGNGNRARNAWRAWTNLGQQIAGGVEQSFRANATLNLLKKGVDPTEVVRRVNRAFVNYSVNNTTERWLRDTIPFLRFTIGSGAWLKQIANEPRLVNWLGRIQGSAENSLGDQQSLPERAKESLALPLPWRDPEGNMQFLIGLGLPVETSLNLMGLGTATGIRRQVLGGLQPALRLPAETVTGRSFYFGDEWGKYRKAPVWMPKGLTQEVKLPDGSVRYEIHGEVNEILNALPTSRLEGLVEKMVSVTRGDWAKLINVTTGARVMSVDVEAELKKRLESYLSEKARTGQVGESLVYFSRMDPESMPEDLKIVLSELEAVKKAKRQARTRRGFAN